MTYRPMRVGPPELGGLRVPLTGREPALTGFTRVVTSGEMGVVWHAGEVAIEGYAARGGGGNVAECGERAFLEPINKSAQQGLLRRGEHIVGVTGQFFEADGEQRLIANLELRSGVALSLGLAQSWEGMQLMCSREAPELVVAQVMMLSFEAMRRAPY